MKRVAPASAMAANVSRQRTGRISARASSSRTSLERLRGGAREDGEARLAELDLVEGRAERRDGGRHRRRVERAGDRQPDRALAELAGDLLGALERVAVAREHELARRVVVGDGQPGGAGDLRGLVLVGADQRDHRAAVVGLGHQAAAQDDELERVVDAQDARGGQRGELAERVAGGGGGGDVVRQSAPAGDRGAEDRGLLEAGALVHARERILAHQLEAALEQLGAALGDVLAHLRGLRSLSGKEQGTRTVVRKAELARTGGRNWFHADTLTSARVNSGKNR